jgi:hypothetical protein
MNNDLKFSDISEGTSNNVKIIAHSPSGNEPSITINGQGVVTDIITQIKQSPQNTIKKIIKPDISKENTEKVISKLGKLIKKVSKEQSIPPKTLVRDKLRNERKLAKQKLDEKKKSITRTKKLLAGSNKTTNNKKNKRSFVSKLRDAGIYDEETHKPLSPTKKVVPPVKKVVSPVKKVVSTVKKVVPPVKKVVPPVKKVVPPVKKVVSPAKKVVSPVKIPSRNTGSNNIKDKKSIISALASGKTSFEKRSPLMAIQKTNHSSDKASLSSNLERLLKKYPTNDESDDTDDESDDDLPDEFNRDFENDILTDEDKINDFIFKFSVLRERNSNIKIPKLIGDNKRDLKRLQIMYNRVMGKMGAKSKAGTYKLVLVVMCMLLQWGCTYFGLESMDGFAQDQYNKMTQYESLLEELGEKNYGSIAGKLPVELKLVGLVILNAVIFFIGNQISNGSFNFTGDSEDGESGGGMLGMLGSVMGMFSGGKTDTNNPSGKNSTRNRKVRVPKFSRKKARTAQ